MKAAFCSAVVAASLVLARADAAERAPSDAALDARVPRLTIRLLVTAPGSTVTLDGAALDPTTLGVDLAVAPGRHEIVVEAPQREPRTFVVTLAEGEHRVLDVSPGAGAFRANGAGPNAAVGDTEDSEHTNDFSQRTVGLSLGGAGLAGLGFGTVFGVVALSGSGDEAQSAGDISKGFLLGGAIAFAAGALVFLTAGPSRH